MPWDSIISVLDTAGITTVIIVLIFVSFRRTSMAVSPAEDLAAIKSVADPLVAAINAAAAPPA